MFVCFEKVRFSIWAFVSWRDIETERNGKRHVGSLSHSYTFKQAN